MHRFTKPLVVMTGLMLGLAALLALPDLGDASSHREAPLISADPLADNTDLYAFVDPKDPEVVNIIANYIPLALPEGGPNYSTFGENIRYEIHIKNQASAGALGTATDDLTYRFTFELENEDPTTFFNIRLGKQNLKATYTLEKSTDGGVSFSTIVTDGVVPPNNIGPRSIEDGTVGLGTTYDALTTGAITTASTGEKVFAGPRDDPFFVDLGGVFDVGHFRDAFGMDAANPANARDAVAGFNTHALALQIPVNMLQKDGMNASQAANILDGDFVIGVWASASRPQITTLSTDGSAPATSGPWIQVSRLGMPLTNEAVIPIGEKDKWNYTTPYDAAEQDFAPYFVNPELALYMGNGAFGAAVPGLSDALKIQKNSYPGLNLDGDGDPSNDGSGLDFTNDADGAAAVLPLVTSGDLDIAGSAFAVQTRPAVDGVPTALLAPGQPRRVDLLPIFYFGVPNLPPYQLATGKGGLVADVDEDGDLDFTSGKPFINNFLPVTAEADGDLYGGDMLRLNMAVPPTDRTTEEYRVWARQGLIRAAAIGLTADPFNTTTDLEAIPHMDGFPNGRRLEDDVTTIELQAVGGLVLAAVGLPEDDATAGDYSDLASAQLIAELSYVAGPTVNDVALLPDFPYLAHPHSGYDYVKQLTALPPPEASSTQSLGLGVPDAFILDQNYPNPFNPTTTIQYHVARDSDVQLHVYDLQGRRVQTLIDQRQTPGTYRVDFDGSSLASGTYFYRIEANGRFSDAKKAVLVK